MVMEPIPRSIVGAEVQMNGCCYGRSSKEHNKDCWKDFHFCLFQFLFHRCFYGQLQVFGDATVGFEKPMQDSLRFASLGNI